MLKYQQCKTCVLKYSTFTTQITNNKKKQKQKIPSE
jgi:hypothetical protein